MTSCLSLLQSRKQLNFLDVIVKVEGEKFATDLFCKNTDCFQNLHYTSFHPKHVKRSTAYGQWLPLKRLCSGERGFDLHLKNLKE